MQRSKLIILGAASALFFAAGAQAKARLTVDAAHDVHFGNYHSFDWASTTPPRGINSVQFHRVQQDIIGKMGHKGYKHQPNADLTLALSVGKLTKVDLDRWNHYGYHDAYTHSEGQVSLDVFDRKTKRAVWHGQVTDAINPNKPDAGKLQVAVDQLLEKFPSH
jgi:uncharacterized GH25 family protein